MVVLSNELGFFAFDCSSELEEFFFCHGLNYWFSVFFDDVYAILEFSKVFVLYHGKPFDSACGEACEFYVCGFHSDHAAVDFNYNTFLDCEVSWIFFSDKVFDGDFVACDCNVHGEVA